MSQHPPPPYALAAIATGIIGSAWSSGTIASLSLIACPTATTLPGAANAQAWAGLYTRGIALMPKVAVATAGVYLYGAYASYSYQSTTTPTATSDGKRKHNRNSWKGYVTAAVLAVSIAPWTWLTMVPTNNELLALAAGGGRGGGGGGGGGRSTNELIEWWAVLNLGRSLLPLTAAVLGFVSLATEWAVI